MTANVHGFPWTFQQHTACDKRTFAEQVPGLTGRHSRCAVGLLAVLRTVSPTLGSRPPVPHTARLARAVGNMRLPWSVTLSMTRQDRRRRKGLGYAIATDP